MSRLVEYDICNIKANMISYDKKFLRQTGLNIVELAKKSVNYKSENNFSVAIITVTSGLGVIGGFSNSIKAIFDYANIKSEIMLNTDVAGVMEAYEKSYDFIFMADDLVCGMFSAIKKVCSDNGYATGISFAQALIETVKKDEKVLVLGAGPVGKAAVLKFNENNILTDVYDTDIEKANKLKEEMKVNVLEKAPNYKEYTKILDATNTGGFIKSTDLNDNTIISAPGMPLAVEENLSDSEQLIHNPLELGVLAMYYETAKKMEGEI